MITPIFYRSQTQFDYMEYTKSEIEEYLRSNLPDKWSDEMCDYIHTHDIRINFGPIFELFMNNEDKISESIFKASDEIVKVFTHVDNFHPIFTYIGYLDEIPNTIEEQIQNHKNAMDLGALVICRALVEKEKNEDSMCQYALDLTYNNPLSIKDKSIANLICNTYRFDEEEYKKALTFISPKEFCELYIETREFNKFDSSFYDKCLKDLGDEKLSYTCFINHFAKFDLDFSKFKGFRRIENLFRKIDNPKALYKYFIIKKFYFIDPYIIIDFIKDFCEMTNIEPDEYLYKQIVRNETERTKKALELSGDNILVKKYFIFESFVLDDIAAYSDQWKLFSKFAQVSDMAELYITSHLPSQFNESIINYFCDHLRNDTLSPSCLLLQHSIFGTKVIKEWALAPEYAKKIMQFIDFNKISAVRKGVDEK